MTKLENEYGLFGIFRKDSKDVIPVATIESNRAGAYHWAKDALLLDGDYVVVALDDVEFVEPMNDFPAGILKDGEFRRSSKKTRRRAQIMKPKPSPGVYIHGSKGVAKTLAAAANSAVCARSGRKTSAKPGSRRTCSGCGRFVLINANGTIRKHKK